MQTDFPNTADGSKSDERLLAGTGVRDAFCGFGESRSESGGDPGRGEVRARFKGIGESAVVQGEKTVAGPTAVGLEALAPITGLKYGREMRV